MLENVLKNPSLNPLVGGIASVTLGDEEARRRWAAPPLAAPAASGLACSMLAAHTPCTPTRPRGVQKSILEREAPPTFDVCVEMSSRGRWRVHHDVALAVDLLLVGKDPGARAALRRVQLRAV